jgi:ParB family transcriptional regulator, chromosome partitioning protein
VISDRHDQQVGAHELLGLTRETVANELATATPKRALHLALALAVASWEQSTTKDTWRRSDTYDQATLAALGGWGYDLSEIEQRVIDGTAADPV